MNVILAGGAGSEHLVSKALAWCQQNGSTSVELAQTSSGVIGVASTNSEITSMIVEPSWVRAQFGNGSSESFSLHQGHPIPTSTVAIHSDERRTLVGSGDGNVRMFQLRRRDGVVVSSSLPALLSAFDFDVTVDRAFEEFFLGFGFYPYGRTLFENVTTLPRPSILDISTGSLVATSDTPTSVGAEDAISPDLIGVMSEVLEEQAGSASHVGVLLGGFDSALVAAILARSGRRVSTFTFAFSSPGYIQNYVDEVVRITGSDHHWVRFDPARIWDGLKNLPLRLNQGSPQPHYQLQTIMAAEEAALAGAEVIFTGDGCDALFAAYPTINTRAATNLTLQRVPRFLRETSLAVLGTPYLENRLGHVARVSRSALRASLLDGYTSQHLPTQYLDEVSLGRLRREMSPLAIESVSETRHRLATGFSGMDPAAIAVNGNAMTGMSQSKVEGAMLRSGRAVLSPYTHPKFRAAVRLLPEHEQRPTGKLRRAEGKPGLQAAAIDANLLSDQIVYQKKQAPTEAPLDDWFMFKLKEEILDHLDHLPFAVNSEYVATLLTPKFAEQFYRNRIAISRHCLQSVGLLVSYASFASLSK